MTTITLKDLSCSLGERTIFSNLNFTVPSQKFFVLYGESGSGKSTLLKLVAGLLAPSAGQILFDDTDVTSLPTQDRGVGFVFQNLCLWSHMTVKNNILFGLQIRGTAKTEQLGKLNAILKSTELTGFEDRYPHQLSGGQQQRVALSRALILEPAIILFDETLSSLDARLRTEMRHHIAELHRAHKFTSIYVTHDRNDGVVLQQELGSEVILAELVSKSEIRVLS